MFNLDQAITEWRWQMQAAGISRPEPLGELEIHLRDEIDQQIKSGLNEDEAFESAVRQIGNGTLLRAEFDKDKQTKTMKRVLIISAGVIAILVGMAFVMPALAQYRHEGVMTGGEDWLLLLGAVLTFGGGSTVLLGARKHAA